VCRRKYENQSSFAARQCYLFIYLELCHCPIHWKRILMEMKHERKKSKQKETFWEDLFHHVGQFREQFQKFQELWIIPINLLDNIPLLQIVLGEFLFNSIYQVQQFLVTSILFSLSLLQSLVNQPACDSCSNCDTSTNQGTLERMRLDPFFSICGMAFSSLNDASKTAGFFLTWRFFRSLFFGWDWVLCRSSFNGWGTSGLRLFFWVSLVK